MTINYYLLIGIAVVISTGLAYLTFRLFSKNKKYVRGGFIAFFTLLFVFTGILMMNSRAYIVKSKTDFSRLVVYGTPEYKLSNGLTILLKMPIQKCMIINDSEEDLVVEKVVYSTSGLSGAKDIFVSPFSTATVNTMSMDYHFDERPPKRISSKERKNEVRFWLRTRKNYEEDYGRTLSPDQIDRLRKALKKKENSSK